ncbi:MAG: DNA/RNA nuclease SfsA [Myxococcota bacterium]
MRFTRPMLRGTLLRRYKRFLADVILENGETVTVHCPNSGSMKACCEPGQPIVVSDSQNPQRKLRYTWEMIRMGRTWVGVHSALSNTTIATGITQGKIVELDGYQHLAREVVYGAGGRSRIDIHLQSDNRLPCFVEIKHSTMRVGEFAAFPDAVTERGRKHLEDLMFVAKGGARAVIFFAVGRADCRRFRPASEIDPGYADVLHRAVQSGVECLAYRLHYSPTQIRIGQALPTDL